MQVEGLSTVFETPSGRLAAVDGVDLAIGRGEAPIDWTRELLEVRDRRLGGVTAPPQGLYFVRADYPSEFGLPQCERTDPLQRLQDV